MANVGDVIFIYTMSMQGNAGWAYLFRQGESAADRSTLPELKKIILQSLFFYFPDWTKKIAIKGVLDFQMEKRDCMQAQTAHRKHCYQIMPPSCCMTASLFGPTTCTRRRRPATWRRCLPQARQPSSPSILSPSSPSTSLPTTKEPACGLESSSSSIYHRIFSHHLVQTTNFHGLTSFSTILLGSNKKAHRLRMVLTIKGRNDEDSCITHCKER